MATISDVRSKAKHAGLHFETWSPGDGYTRYRFFREPTDYHGGDGLYTALGAREAILWLRGYTSCLQGHHEA